MSSVGIRLILAVVYVEEAVWTLLEGEVVERCFDWMLLNNSDITYDRIVSEKSLIFYVFDVQGLGHF